MGKNFYEAIPEAYKFAHEVLDLAESRGLSEVAVAYLPQSIEGILKEERKPEDKPYKRPGKKTGPEEK